MVMAGSVILVVVSMVGDVIGMSGGGMDSGGTGADTGGGVGAGWPLEALFVLTIWSNTGAFLALFPSIEVKELVD